MRWRKMNEIKINENSEINTILKNILNNALKEIMAAVDAECGSLFIFDLENEELILDTFYNSNNLSIKGLRKKMGEGVSGKVASMKAPVLVKDIDRDARFRRNGFNHYRTNSFISIPLFSQKGALGLINLADKSSGGFFSEEDLKFALAISRYACWVIEDISSYLGAKDKYASVGKLAAGIVHEINNPLDGIIRYVNILQAQVENNSTLREYLSEVKSGLNRIAGITKTLLQFSHQVNSQTSKTKKYIDLNKLIDETLDIFTERINGDIKIQKTYRSNLGRIRDLGLEHVVVNIIRNAIDAMPEGGILDISTNLRDSGVEIRFKDTGLGIPSEIKERIFEPFFTTKSTDKGTGFGLSICQETVNRYSGKIEAQSLPGRGSTFTVTIPKGFLENA